MTRNQARWLIKSIEQFVNMGDSGQLKYHLKKLNIKTEINKNEIIKIFNLLYEKQQISILMNGFCFDLLDFSMEGSISQIFAIASYQAKIVRIDKCIICDNYIIKWSKRKSLTCSPNCRQRKKRKD
jgi:hypothetical protein